MLEKQEQERATNNNRDNNDTEDLQEENLEEKKIDCQIALVVFTNTSVSSSRKGLMND